MYVKIKIEKYDTHVLIFILYYLTIIKLTICDESFNDHEPLMLLEDIEIRVITRFGNIYLWLYLNIYL